MKKKIKIAILGDGNINNRKGYLNALINRTKYLKKICPFQIDAYLISDYDPWYIRKLRKTSRPIRKTHVEVDGVIFKIIWKRFSIIDYILKIRFHINPIFLLLFNYRISKTFSQYDLINCHSFNSGLIAFKVWEKYQIPYVITWHGSDIHTIPFQNKWIKKQTSKIMENALCNFFVSKTLLDQSQGITSIGRKELLYNGVGENFYQYSEEKRNALKRQFNLEKKKIVMYCGGFVGIKNIFSLPQIFHNILKKMPNVVFWMIGDGKYRRQLEEEMKNLPVKFWGNQNPNYIPQLMNIANVLVLPSFNEGLPLVTIEALSCGCYVVGSDRGGIPEAIGIENCVSIEDKNFSKRIAEKVLHYLLLEERFKSNIAPYFNWDTSAEKENSIICEHINKHLEK